MNLHAIIQYLKYRWRAKGRHGVHSPFAYDLIEHVLLDKGVIEREYIVEYPSLALCYENLLSRIATCYKYKAILYLPLENEDVVKTNADLLLLNEVAPKQWLNLLNKYFHLLNSQGAVAVIGIHKTMKHTTAWKNLCTDQNVKMSIDMYGVGLLLFRDEFKEKQHFVLKY